MQRPLLRVCMIVVCGGVLIAGFGSLPSGCEASSPSVAGFGGPSIFPQIATSGGPLEPFTILTSIGGDYSLKGAMCRGTLRLGPHLELISGDLAHAVRASAAWEGDSSYLWSVVLRASRFGSTEIRAFVRMDVPPDRFDEMELLLPLEVGADGVKTGRARTVRTETVRAGQRYRSAGEFLVPIDGPENVMPWEIKERPHVLVARKGTCAECPGEEHWIPFVVFVGPHGEIRSHRFLGTDRDARGATPAMIETAEEALKDWKFAPARTKSRTVTDWITVRVSVSK